MQSALLGHNCVQLATHEPPLDLTSSDGTWWVQTNAVLFNALCLSVPENVRGKLTALVGHGGSFRQGLLKIQELYFRPSPYTSFSLMDELNKFRPLPNEDMLSYTTRAQKLAELFQHFGEPLTESTLSLAVFRPLGELWNEVLQRLPGFTQLWQFEHLCRELLEEDYRRRLFYKGQDRLRAPLHLQDWGSSGRKAVGNAYTATDAPEPDDVPAPTGSAHAAQSRVRSPQKSSSQTKFPSPKRFHQTSQSGTRPKSFLLCFHCKQWGHRWTNCSSLPTGWTPDEHRVHECMQKVWQERRTFRPKSPVKQLQPSKESKTVSWRDPEASQVA